MNTLNSQEQIIKEFFTWEENDSTLQSKNKENNGTSVPNDTIYETKKSVIEKPERDTKKEYKKNWYLKNKHRILKSRKEYYVKNRKTILDYHVDYLKSNKQKIRDYKKGYRKQNAEYIKNSKREYANVKYKTDIQFKLKSVLRARLRAAINIGCKTGSAVRDLGCSIEEFKCYIESKFQPGMSWDNHGLFGWHIDHIKPLKNFDLTDRNQLLEAVHYTNLQPLWAKENLVKDNNQ